MIGCNEAEHSFSDSAIGETNEESANHDRIVRSHGRVFR